MGFDNTSRLVAALEARGELKRVASPVSAELEVGVIQRRAFANGGPALLFENVTGCAFPMAANLYGTRDRLHFIFSDTLRTVERIMRLKVDPLEVVRRPWRFAAAPRALWNTRPKMVDAGPVTAHETSVSRLPQLKSWPRDGGAYVTLPQVYTESPARPGFARSNLGMYRVQLTGNEFVPDREVGLHYQIHRGIGAHHAEAKARGVPLAVNVFVGGPPAMTLAAVMPLPEGMPEVLFAGLLAGRRIRMVRRPGHLPVPAEADFALTGRILPEYVKPEGPFGDHLGYYSLAHDFPVMEVDKVFHRPDAIWPFTTVGRPPQEDTIFGEFIHELTRELVPTVFAGVHQVHAVDAAGVHPLLLAVGSERYVPYAAERIPQELLTNACSLLGNTQTALSKYVLIAAREDAPGLDANDVPGFFAHVLERTDFSRDLHFLTRTTMDTLDYSGISLNQGSKVVWAAAGAPRRTLATELPAGFSLPQGVSDAYLFCPGVVVVRAPAHATGRDEHDPLMEALAEHLAGQGNLEGIALVVAVDDAAFAAACWDNFLWTAFTRSDPATDLYGAGAFVHCKHWGCAGPLVMDARKKTYHAPPLETDPEVERRVDELGAPGGELHGIV